MKLIVPKICCYLLLLCVVFVSVVEAASSKKKVLKIDHTTAIMIAVRKNPIVASYKEQVEVFKGDLLQASLIPNPELSIEIENFGGAGDLSGFKGTETTITIEQLIEIGGKRKNRREVAQKGFEIALLNYEIAKLDVATAAEKAFWRSYVLEKKVKLARELLNLAKATLETVRARVDAGKVSQIEEIKAKVFLSTSEILYKEAIHQELAARKALISSLGGGVELADFFLEDNSTISPPQSLEELLSKIKNGLRIRQLKLKEELAKKRLKMARTKAIPDVTFGFGVRHFEETDDQAFIASVSVPIPIFNRNQGESLKSLHEITQTKYEQMARELELTQQLFQRYHQLQNAYEELERLARETLPNAKKGFEATKEAYSYGKFSYLDVLDAQRTLYELELRYLDALLRYRLSLADIKSLIGDISQWD